MNWTPFVKSELETLTDERLREMLPNGISLEQARAIVEKQNETLKAVWVNSLYQVNVYEGNSAPGEVPVIWLSIKRRDKAAVHDWRHFQRIKNELVGPEFEAVELYPAESRLVDTANQYHLFVIGDPAFRFPFGFNERMVVEESHDGKWKQRERNEEAR